jgi:chromosome segregation ATPase
MAYDVNSALERLEQNLTQLDSARKQVEKTVHASNDLQTIVAGYVASINKLVGEIKEWEKSLEGIQIKFSESANKALTDMKASCEKISTDFSASVDDSIKKFSEQNSLLEKKVKEMDALRDEIKSATKEIQTVKDLLSNISKDLKDSQNKQDETLEHINQQVSELPGTINDYADGIKEHANSLKDDLKRILDEAHSIILAIDKKNGCPDTSRSNSSNYK